MAARWLEALGAWSTLSLAIGERTVVAGRRIGATSPLGNKLD